MKNIIIMIVFDSYTSAKMAKSQNISHVIRLDCHHKENTNTNTLKYEKFLKYFYYDLVHIQDYLFLTLVQTFYT